MFTEQPRLLPIVISTDSDVVSEALLTVSSASRSLQLGSEVAGVENGHTLTFREERDEAAGKAEEEVTDDQAPRGSSAAVASPSVAEEEASEARFVLEERREERFQVNAVPGLVTASLGAVDAGRHVVLLLPVMFTNPAVMSHPHAGTTTRSAAEGKAEGANSPRSAPQQPERHTHQRGLYAGESGSRHRLELYVQCAYTKQSGEAAVVERYLPLEFVCPVTVERSITLKER